jgi:hypothetical protein
VKPAAGLLLASGVLALAGCVSVQGRVSSAAACPSGEASQPVAQLIFGRNIGDRLGVSEEDFTRFLDEEVTPRFPEGLTVQDSQGRWLSNGVLYREPGKVVTLILPGHADDRAKVDAIAKAYERRFRQEAVLGLISPACVSFHMPEAR